MTAPVSKVLSDEKAEACFRELWCLIEMARYDYIGNTNAQVANLRMDELKADRAAMRAERASMLELVAELAEALDEQSTTDLLHCRWCDVRQPDACDQHDHREQCPIGKLLARAQALASEKEEP